MGGSKKVKIGYKYFFGIQMGLARGPIDELIAIRVGDLEAWTGSVSANGSFTINAPELFGGEKKEGGIAGLVDYYSGQQDQVVVDTTPNPIPRKAQGPFGGLHGMLTRMGCPVPGFRGVSTMFFTGEVCSINPYPKAWKMRIRRALRGWSGDDVWYPAKAVIPMADGAIKAMNPAHILVQAATDPDWGRGLNRARLNIDSYTIAADKLYAEGFGLCFRYTRSGTITEFIQSVVNHIGAIQEINRRTGLLELTLIRDDYDVNSLPLFTYGTGLLSVSDLETPSQDNSTNQMIVKWHNPLTDEDDVTPPIDNLSSIVVNGTNSETKEYFGIPTLELAGRVALRDLNASSGMLRKMTLTFDRRGYDIRPGTVFRIQALDQGINDIVLRAVKLQDGTLEQGTITVVAIQDVFGLASSSYILPQPVGWIPPDRLPRDPVTKRLREASWRDVITHVDGYALQSIANGSTWVTGLAVKPSGLAVGYQFYTALNGSGYEQRAGGDWVPTALIKEAMPLSGQPMVVTLEGFDNLIPFVVGAAVIVDNEEMVILAVDDNSARITLGRGAQDTVPASHFAGARIWVYTDTMSFDPHEWVASQTIYGKFLTTTSTAQLALDAASAPNLPTVGRATRPYPPGNLRINGSAYHTVTAISTSQDFALTWAHRDRISQDEALFDHTVGNIGPETGVTYTVQIFNTDGVLVRETANINGTAWTYTAAQQQTDNTVNGFTFKLFSVRGGLASWQSYSMPIARLGLGYGLGLYLGGSI